MSNTMLNQSTNAPPQNATEQAEGQAPAAGQSAANSSVAERAALARGLPPGFRRLTAPFFEGGDPPAEAAFESGVYRVIADAHEAVPPLLEALRGAGFDTLAVAANRANQIYQIDVPLAGRLQEAVTDLTRGGDLPFNTTEVVQCYGRLSRHAKAWLRESEQVSAFITARLSSYIGGSSLRTHAVAIAELSPTQMMQLDVVRPIADRRSRGCQALLSLIQTGRFPRSPGDAEPATAEPTRGTTAAGATDAESQTEGQEGGDGEADPAADAERINEAAAALTTQIENALGPAPEAGGDLDEQRAARATEGRLSPEAYRDLLQTIESAEPAVKDIVYANATLMDRLQSSASVQQVGGLMRALDSVEGIYQECLRFRRTGGNARQGETPPKPPFELISTFLRQLAGDDKRESRNRILAHTRLKDDFIDLLPESQNQLVYRLVVRGTDEPTPVDQVHEAVRTNNGALAARALMELATSDPEALAGLEADQIFRNSISQLTEEVDVGGAPVVPYHLCLSLWGRVPGQSTDPGRLGGPEVDNPNGDTRPLNVEERTKLRTQLYDPAARNLREELDDFWGVNNSIISTRLRAFANKAAREDFVELIRRDGVTQGQRLCESYQRLFNHNLRTDIRNGVDDEGRREADRILDISIDSASVGTVEGQATRAGDRREQHVTLDQALGEVTTDGGTVASVAFHNIVTDLHDELSEWAINGGAELSDYRSIVNRVPRLWTDIGPKLIEATGLRNLHWAELLSNAYAEVGGSLSAEIAEEWSGSDRTTALRLAGIHPDQVQERADQAAEANRDPNEVLREQAEGLYKDRAQALFAKFTSLNRRSPDSELEETRTLQANYRLARQIDRGALPVSETTPLRPSPADQDISTAAGYYRATFGVDLGEHARRVARSLIPEQPREGERNASQVCRLLGVDEIEAAAPIAAPVEDELVIDERNRTMVRPGFTVGVAESNARDMWRILHGDGEIHLINAVLYGPYTDEEQRLIRVAFRRFSGGLDYQFYLQQAMERRRQGASGASTFSRVQAEGTEAGEGALEGIQRQQVIGAQPGDVLIDADETELATALEVATEGEIDNTSRLRSAVGNGDVDQIFRIVEELEDADCRRVLSDQALMHSLESATGGVAWDRVYRILTGQATLADRLVSRSEGDYGFWGFLDATDEQGMRDDIKAYIRTLRRRHERAVRAEIPDPRQADVEINRRVRADCLTLLSNADVGAIIEDELSGFERSQADSIMYGNGEESRVAHVLRDGDWTDPEDEIIESIRQMPQAERERLRNDPEYIRRLGDLCDTEEQFRDAMNALSREGASRAEGGGEDHLAALDEASRGPHEVAGDMNRDESAIISNLAELSEDEYRRLLANPRLRAQILAGLDNDPEERELARQMLAFRFGDASAELGVEVAGPNQSPADGALSQEEGEELAYLKFNAVMRIRSITSEGRSWDRMLRAAVEVFKLKFEGAGNASPAAAPEADAEANPDATQAPAAPSPNARAEHAARARQGAWNDVSAEVQNWAHAELDGNGTERRTKINIIRDAVLHVADPSGHRLTDNVGNWDEDDDIVEALANASDEIIVNEWSSVINNPALGGPSMKAVYDEYVEAKEAAESSARAEVDPDALAEIESQPEGAETEETTEEPAIGQEDRDAAMASMREGGGRPMPPVGSDLSTKQLAFMNYVVDISDDFENVLFQHAGSWFHGDSGENTSTTRRDNKQWHEWADAIRDRIPRLPDTLVGQALGIDPSSPDHALITNPNRTAMTRANRRLNQYLRQRGANHTNTRFASDEAENLDVAMTRYGRALGETQIGETPEGYGVISETEGNELEENYGREVDRAVGDFKAAKAAIAQWASIIVGVLVTAIITILTAGVATGPAAAIMMSAVTAAMSATASAATQEMIMQGDYDFSGEGLESVAQAAVTGIITAGATYYGQVITRNIAGIGGDAAKMAGMMRASQPPGWGAIASEVGEELISESITGLAEAGLEYLDPTIWLEGWDEGVRRGNAAAGERIGAMPKMYLQAALTSLVLSGSHRVLPRGNNPLGEQIEDNLEGRVNVRQNFRAFFGDQTDVMLEAFTSYAIQKGMEGDINLEDVPGDLVRAYLDEMKEQALDMHVGTAHAGVLRRRVRADVEAHRDQLTDEELEDFLAMNQLTLDQQNLAFGGDEEGANLQISVTDYIRLRETAARASAQAFAENSGQELTPDQIAEFVMYVRRAPSIDEFRQRLLSNPLEIGQRLAGPIPIHDEVANDATTELNDTPPPEQDVSEDEVDATLTTPDNETSVETVETLETTEVATDIATDVETDVETETQTPVTSELETDEATFSGEQFPVPDLVLGPGRDREQMAQFGRDQAVEAARLNAELEAKIEAGMDPSQAMKELYEAFSAWRVQWQVDNNFDPTKFEAPITDGDSNYDPFGVMPGLEADGQATPASTERAAIGQIMKDRFADADQAAAEAGEPGVGDTLQTEITLPDGTIVNGNRLHRGEAAQEIYDKKGQKYDYEDGNSEMFISETGTEADRAQLYEAGVASLGALVGEADAIAADPAARDAARARFAAAAYFLFHGPQANRGSDSVIRGVLTVAHQQIFGEPVVLPQDIDVQAYGLDQAGFVAFLTTSIDPGQQSLPPAQQELQSLPPTESEIETETQTEMSNEPETDTVRPVSDSEVEMLAKIGEKVEELARENTETDEESKKQRADAEVELAALIETLGLDSMSAQERQQRLSRLSQAARNYVIVRADSRRRTEFQETAEDHGRLEVHNHFMGIVEPDVFADRVARVESRDPNNAGKSSWEMTLDAIAEMKDSGMAHTVDDEGKHQRGISGDALILVEAAQAEIAAMRAEAEETRTEVDEAAIAKIAQEAVRKALIATEETDFNSSYEVRDELIKKYFGKQENEAGELEPTHVEDSEKEAAIAGAEQSVQMDEDTPPEKVAAVKKAVADKAIRNLPAYADYSHEAIRVLLIEGQLYSEQSQSLNKLLRSFPAEMLQRIIEHELKPETIIANLEAGVITEADADKLLKAKPIVLRNLAMILTQSFAPTDTEGHEAFEKRAGKPDRRRDPEHAQDPKLSEDENEERERQRLAHDASIARLEAEDTALREQMESGTDQIEEPPELRAHGEEFIAEQEKSGLFDQFGRGDTTGIDIAGPEEFAFTAGGRARFRALYRKLSEISTETGDKLVLRPHVGEGSLDLKDTESAHGVGNAERTEAGELTHYDRARENVDALITSLEELQAMGELDTDKVEVRFGHSTHATPEQIVRLQKLGVIAEINLESNVQTLSLDPTNPETGKVEQGRFDDHALISLLYYQVDLILSTDAHSVMSTDLAQEYAKAFTLIEAFLHGQLPLRLRPDEAQGRGREMRIGDPETGELAHELFVGDLDDAELERFLGAYQTIMSFAEEYRDDALKRNGPDSNDPEQGPDVDPKGPDTDPKGPDVGPVGPSQSQSSQELAGINQTIRERYAGELGEPTLVGPAGDAPVLTSTPDDALIGLPVDVIGPDGDYQAATETLQENGIPRYELLTEDERKHEEAFIAEVEANIPAAVDAIYAMAGSADPDSFVFEVDAAKRLYSAYGPAGKAQSESETEVRLTANHAMHPTAVAVTRLAFLKRLDELAGLAPDDPKRKVFVTNGGCAAGKGSLTGLVEESTGAFEFGAVWDAAGEGDAQENGWILSAAASRGLQVTFGFVENDPVVQYESVLGRAESKGRIVDPVTFARSYINGQKNFRAFLESPEYQAAVRGGQASAFGMFTGAFNKKSLTDENEKPYPQMRLLGDEGKISGSDDLAAPADLTTAIEAALGLFDEWRAEKEGEGKDVDDYFIGAIVNTLKFGRPEEAVFEDEEATAETEAENEKPEQTSSEVAAATELEQELGPVATDGPIEIPKPPPHSLDNVETRKWYHHELEQIPSRLDHTLPLKELAIQAFEMRNAVKLAARELMADREAAAKLPPPRSLANVVTRALSRGVEGDELWHQLLTGSQKSNADVDKRLGLK